VLILTTLLSSTKSTLGTLHLFQSAISSQVSMGREI
jgi:hypothetical protein